MKKRSLLFTALALVLVAAISIGGTMAYFSSSTTRTNTITFGNVKIEVVEDEWDKTGSDIASDLVPNVSFAKDPKVKNIGANPCYVRIKRPDFIKASYDKGWKFSSNLFEIFTGSQSGLNVGNGTSQWTYGGDDYFYYNSIVPVGNESATSTLFTKLKLKFNAVNKVENNPQDKSFNPPDSIELTKDTMDITIYAEAVQSEGDIANMPGDRTAAQKAFAKLNFVED